MLCFCVFVIKKGPPVRLYTTTLALLTQNTSNTGCVL